MMTDHRIWQSWLHRTAVPLRSEGGQSRRLQTLLRQGEHVPVAGLVRGLPTEVAGPSDRAMRKARAPTIGI